MREDAYLAFGYEYGHILIQTRRNSELSHPLNAQLVPDSCQIIAVVKLDFVGHEASAVPFVRGVL